MNLITVHKNHDVLQLQVIPLPQWEEFTPWAQQLLRQTGLNHLNDGFEGADRHMLIFTFKDTQFSLNYEGYSESIWIATEEVASTQHLDALKSLFEATIIN